MKRLLGLLALGLALVLILPLTLRSGSLASEVLIYGLAGMGCNLLLGYTGLLVVRPGHFLRPGQLHDRDPADPRGAADAARAAGRHGDGCTRRGRGRLDRDPPARHLLRDVDAGLRADVLFPGLHRDRPDRRRQRPAGRAAPGHHGLRRHAAVAQVAVAVLRFRRGGVPGRDGGAVAGLGFDLRPHAAGDPRQRGARRGRGLQPEDVQAAGVHDLVRRHRAWPAACTR